MNDETTPQQPQFAPPLTPPPTQAAWLAPGVAYADGAAPVAAPPKRPWLVPVIVAGSVIVIGALLAATVFLVLPSASSEKPASSASIEEVEESPSADKPESSNDEEARQVFSPSDPQLEGAGPIADRLQSFSDSYREKFDDGSLWQLMPQNAESQGAYLAFQFILSDMKSATRFGTTTEEDELYYSQRARYIEARLLAQEPLGTSVTYKLSDGRTFSYDGDTGEVNLK